MQAPTTTVGALPAAPEPSDLAVAIRVAQTLLADYGDTTGYDHFAYAQAHGGLSEALRILLRALGAESSPRCPAALPADPSPCGGPITVTVLDPSKRGADGCERHAIRLLAALPGSYPIGLPDAPAGSAVRVFKAAGALRGGEGR
ncbi:hypothetical protein J7E95_24765 [Streptomyces sp. ISL-14]|nr:hypothetical protein [Streptomyces sp. ISL-14]